MPKLRVKAINGEYDILIEEGAMDSVAGFLAGYRTAAVVTDSNVSAIYGEKLLDLLDQAGLKAFEIVIDPGEATKCHESLVRIYNGLIERHVTRSDVILAFGGGVVGDIAGFAAATYFRGTPFIQIPTTLLAQVDSSVGGKVAINLPQAKNSIGCFYQPEAVLVDTQTLSTLPGREYSAGMAEIIKYGAIADFELFERLEKGIDNLEDVILRCLEIKAAYVEEDPFDKGKRMELNFGVAMGMVAMARMGEVLKITPEGTAKRIAGVVKKYGLATGIKLDKEQKKAVAKAILADKKLISDRLNIILLQRIGEAIIYPVNSELVFGILENII